MGPPGRLDPTAACATSRAIRAAPAVIVSVSVCPPPVPEAVWEPVFGEALIIREANAANPTLDRGDVYLVEVPIDTESARAPIAETRIVVTRVRIGDAHPIFTDIVTAAATRDRSAAAVAKRPAALAFEFLAGQRRAALPLIANLRSRAVTVDRSTTAIIEIRSTLDGKGGAGGRRAACVLIANAGRASLIVAAVPGNAARPTIDVAGYALTFEPIEIADRVRRARIVRTTLTLAQFQASERSTTGSRLTATLPPLRTVVTRPRTAEFLAVAMTVTTGTITAFGMIGP